MVAATKRLKMKNWLTILRSMTLTSKLSQYWLVRNDFKEKKKLSLTILKNEHMKNKEVSSYQLNNSLKILDIIEFTFA